MSSVASPLGLYAILSAGVLLGAGGLIAALRKAGVNVRHAATSYRSWLAMVPLLLGALLAGRVATIVFFTLVAGAAFREFARATGLARDRAMTAMAGLGLVACGVTALISDPKLGTPGWYGLFAVLPAYVVPLLFAVPVLRDRTRGQIEVVALGVVGFLYLGWLFGHVAFLANARWGVGYLLYLVFAVEITDVASYVVGNVFGRRPLRKAVSPGKTWEGAWGGFTVAMILPWVLGASFEHFGVVERLLAGLIVGIGAPVGDLAASVLKRDLGIKNTGEVIPGHGGVLDRIDSLIFTAPLFFHMARYFHGL